MGLNLLCVISTSFEPWVSFGLNDSHFGLSVRKSFDCFETSGVAHLQVDLILRCAQVTQASCKEEKQSLALHSLCSAHMTLGHHLGYHVPLIRPVCVQRLTRLSAPPEVGCLSWVLLMMAVFMTVPRESGPNVLLTQSSDHEMTSTWPSQTE